MTFSSLTFERNSNSALFIETIQEVDAVSCHVSGFFELNNANSTATATSDNVFLLCCFPKILQGSNSGLKGIPICVLKSKKEERNKNRKTVFMPEVIKMGNAERRHRVYCDVAARNQGVIWVWSNGEELFRTLVVPSGEWVGMLYVPVSFLMYALFCATQGVAGEYDQLTRGSFSRPFALIVAHSNATSRANGDSATFQSWRIEMVGEGPMPHEWIPAINDLYNHVTLLCCLWFRFSYYWCTPAKRTFVRM